MEKTRQEKDYKKSAKIALSYAYKEWDRDRDDTSWRVDCGAPEDFGELFHRVHLDLDYPLYDQILMDMIVVVLEKLEEGGAGINTDKDAIDLVMDNVEPEKNYFALVNWLAYHQRNGDYVDQYMGESKRIDEVLQKGWWSWFVHITCLVVDYLPYIPVDDEDEDFTAFSPGRMPTMAH